MGGQIKPGRYLNPATPADIAPTLARLLRVQPPSNAVGRALVEAIK
jgi:arylsulfatase A-like enzyme